MAERVKYRRSVGRQVVEPAGGIGFAANVLGKTGFEGKDPRLPVVGKIRQLSIYAGVN
jgi:hypothetical protein